MNYGLWGKPIGLAAGAGDYVIGPGFATYPAFPATLAGGFAKAVPVSAAVVAPYGKPFYGKPFWGI